MAADSARPTELPPYPVNYLRNVALQLSPNTSHFFHLDVDFVPMPTLYSELLRQLPTGKRRALVVPAFETKDYRSAAPASKAELLAALDHGQIQAFRADVWPQGHGPTDYARWRQADAARAQPYSVRYAADFEPYVVLAWADQPPLFDTRFVGFGWK